MVGRMGVEPITNELKVRCSPLSFHPVILALTSISITPSEAQVKP
jgi:hypothetical protein